MYLSIVLSTLCILFYQYQLSKAMSSGNVDHIENNEVATLTRSTTASTTTIKTTSTTTSLPFQTTTTTTERTVTKFKSYEENNSYTELTVIPIVLLEPDWFFFKFFLYFQIAISLICTYYCMDCMISFTYLCKCYQFGNILLACEIRS